MRWRTALLLTIAATPLLAAGVWAQTVIGGDSRTGLTLVVAQDGTALVRDRRAASLEAGDQALVIEPMPHQAVLAAAGVTGPGISVKSQSLDVGGIDANVLLKAHLGQDVTVIWRTANGAEREERATILSADGVPVFRVGGKVVAGTPERVVYDTLPAGLYAVPVLRADISVDKAGRRDLDIRYLTQGISWKPAYVAELDGGKMLLSAWADVSNQSGGDFPHAALRLLAGEPSRAEAPLPRMARMEKAAPMMAAALADGGISREALGPHHLYTLGQNVSLRDGQSVQVPFLAPQRLGVERVLDLPPLPPHAWVARWGAEPGALHPDAVLSLRNTSGQPLPAGPVRLFQRGADESLALAGEAALPMVPSGAPFTLSLGKAFDVTAKRVQTDLQKIAADITETSWEVRLTNGGDAAAKVRVREGLAGEWLILEESLRHDKTDAAHAAWIVSVPAKGEAVLRYRARIKQ